MASSFFGFFSRPDLCLHEIAVVLHAQVIELGRKLGQGPGSRRASYVGGEGRGPARQGSFLLGPRRQSSSSGGKLGLRRQGSSLQLSCNAPMQLEQILTGGARKHTHVLPLIALLA